MPKVAPAFRVGDSSSLDVFNRLLAKNIRPIGWIPNTHLDIKLNQVKSRQEEWTTDQLERLTRGHNDTSGKDFDCPIIVAEYEGVRRLLDGNHRINRWIAARDTQLHKVNIHSIVGVGQFIVRPRI